MKEFTTDRCAIYNGDCVEVSKMLPSETVDFTVYSPPFSNLYTYSDSIYDMGNTENDEEFFNQYRFAIKEKYRLHKKNTYSCVHCKDLPLYKGRDGASGLSDFTGAIIKAHELEGFIYQGKFRVWKDPVIEMQRTKNHGLLHKNYTKRSEAVRQGMADYVLIFKKIGNKDGIYGSRNTADFGEETVNRCCELWANKTDNIVSIFHGGTLEEEFNFGFFEYHEILGKEDSISKALKNGRNITVAFKEYDLLIGDEKVGKLDNTVDFIQDMKKYNMVFHSRCYLTNGTELVTFRKWDSDFEDGQVVRDLDTQCYVGKDAPNKISNSKRDLVGYSIHCWQRYASPVWNDLDDLPKDDFYTWFDINQTNVLNVKQARDDKDEKHICPLQLDLIRKCVSLYSKKNDVCMTFFGGIGSEPNTFLEMERKAVAVELKRKYFEIMVNNIKKTIQRRSLF